MNALNDLTIQETMQATGYSRQTISAYLSRGLLRGRKAGGGTSPWLIPADEVERLRQQRVKELKTQLAAISEPVISVDVI
jgi:DNA-binding transcriptional MerR regulator